MNLSLANVATILVLGYAIVGAALVLLSATGVVNSTELQLSFRVYLEQMAIATAGLAVGRGISTRTNT